MIAWAILLRLESSANLNRAGSKNTEKRRLLQERQVFEPVVRDLRSKRGRGGARWTNQLKAPVDMAFAIRPDLQPDEAQLYAARTEIKHAYSSYYPSLTFDGSLLRFLISECGQGRVIPLTDEAYELLLEWHARFPNPQPDHYVFPSERYGFDGEDGHLYRTVKVWGWIRQGRWAR